MESLRIYVTAEEKEIITSIAKQKNISVTQLVKDTCINLLNPSAQMKDTSLDLDKLKSNRSVRIVVYVSKEEFEQIQHSANEKGWTITRYVREKLYETNAPIHIDYMATDIHELSIMISDAYRHLIGTADALKLRSVLSEHDVNRIKNLAYEIKDALERCTTQAYRNRYAIRKTAIRHLDKQIEKAINDIYKGETK